MTPGFKLFHTLYKKSKSKSPTINPYSLLNQDVDDSGSFMSLSLAFFLMADSNLGTNFFYFPGKIQKMMTGTKRQCLNRIHINVL